MIVTETTYADAVIIGAGAGGLNAARLLDAAGRSVIVLESRDRIGGRLLAHRSPDGAVLDLGATWFWAGEERVVDLIRGAGLQIHDQHLTGDAMYQDLQRTQRIDGNPIDVPAGRFSGGAVALAQALAERLPPESIRLRSPVRAVGAVDDRLRVDYTDGSIETDHVVVALPPALAVHRIAFDPALPDRLAGLAAVTPVWMGAIAKVVVRYRSAFWRDLGLAGAAISHRGPMREIHDMSGPDGSPAALFGFVPLQPDGPVPDVDALLGQLVALFGEEAAAPTEVAVHDWRSDPDTSPPGVERLTAYQAFGDARFREPAMDGRLHWASTETASTSPGHIEGALAAGERAARTILQHASTRTEETPS